MKFKHKLGKKPARVDYRIERMSRHLHGVLPPPPPSANWFSRVNSWGMLNNDQLGDCVEAAILHQILMMSTYAGKALIPTDAEALSFYEAAAGYNPSDPSTDQGSYMAGPGGVLQFWSRTGVTCGGVVNRPTSLLAITKPRPVEWQQAIATFGSVLIGLQLPLNVVSGASPPAVWSDPTGEVAGGHEILAVGYEQSTKTVDIISWGTRYQATQNFLLGTVDEVYTVIDTAFLNAQGTTPSGLNLVALEAYMAALRLA